MANEIVIKWHLKHLKRTLTSMRKGRATASVDEAIKEYRQRRKATPEIAEAIQRFRDQNP